MIEEFVWKHLDIEQSVIDNIQQKYRNVLPKNSHFFQVVDPGITHFLGLEVQRFVLIQVDPNAKGRIHTDWRPDKSFGDKLALNIALENCEHSVTEMWQSSYDPPTQYTSNGQPYRYFDPELCTKIGEFNLSKPVLFRTDLPHSVNNSSNLPRRAISIRFKQDPWHLI